METPVGGQIKYVENNKCFIQYVGTYYNNNMYNVVKLKTPSVLSCLSPALAFLTKRKHVGTISALIFFRTVDESCTTMQINAKSILLECSFEIRLEMPICLFVSKISARVMFRPSRSLYS